jgi:uncharacterized protein YjbJ (UPF0337 family)
MTEPEDESVPESPATWENVVVGRAEELLGKAVGDGELEEEGKERAEIAHEVREEYDEEHHRS